MHVLESRKTFDKAIVGIIKRSEKLSKESDTPGTEMVVYDYEKVLQGLIDDGMEDRDEAVEWYQFNIIGTYLGEQTPAFLFLKYSQEVEMYLEDVEIEAKGILNEVLKDAFVGIYERFGEESIPLYDMTLVPPSIRDQVAVVDRSPEAFLTLGIAQESTPKTTHSPSL